MTLQMISFFSYFFTRTLISFVHIKETISAFGNIQVYWLSYSVVTTVVFNLCSQKFHICTPLAFPFSFCVQRRVFQRRFSRLFGVNKDQLNIKSQHNFFQLNEGPEEDRPRGHPLPGAPGIKPRHKHEQSSEKRATHNQPETRLRAPTQSHHSEASQHQDSSSCQGNPYNHAPAQPSTLA